MEAPVMPTLHPGPAQHIPVIASDDVEAVVGPVRPLRRFKQVAHWDASSPVRPGGADLRSYLAALVHCDSSTYVSSPSAPFHATTTRCSWTGCHGLLAARSPGTCCRREWSLRAGRLCLGQF